MGSFNECEMIMYLRQLRVSLTVDNPMDKCKNIAIHSEHIIASLFLSSSSLTHIVHANDSWVSLMFR